MWKQVQLRQFQIIKLPGQVVLRNTGPVSRMRGAASARVCVPRTGAPRALMYPHYVHLDEAVQAPRAAPGPSHLVVSAPIAPGKLVPQLLQVQVQGALVRQ